MATEQEILITVDADGATTSLYKDEFSIGFLGDMSISRASQIVFNEKTQLWDILLTGQETSFQAARGFQTYTEAVRFEVRFLQECAKKYPKVDPLSPDGEAVAEELYKNEVVYG